MDKKGCGCKVRVTSTVVAMLINSPGHIYSLYITMKLDISQRFGQAISNHLLRWDVGQLDYPGGHLIIHIMVLDIDVFCPRVEYWVMH